MKLKSINNTFPIQLLLVFIFLGFNQLIHAQTYGLEFHGYQVTLDKRTELDLTPDKFIEFKDNFEISFCYKALKTNPNSNIGFFGYIFRIIDNNDNNVDLISTPSPQIGLNLVVGNTNKVIPVNYFTDPTKEWIHMRVQFILNEDYLIFHINDSSYVHENIGFEKNGSFKITFGANDYKQFKTSDVPTITIRDIKISENEKTKYHWPLNEKSGITAIDRIKKRKARVLNPSWLVVMHQNWQKVYEEQIAGYVRVVANEKNGEIFMVGKNQLNIFYTQKNTAVPLEYKNNPTFLDVNYRAIYNSNDNKIYCYTVDGLPYYSLDVSSGKWNDKGTRVNFQTQYRHHNSYFKSSDNSFYSFAGYGGHRYRNDIYKFSLNDSSIVRLPTNNSIFSPRYLAGLAELNDTIYLLGGYGSTSGNQLINPQSYFNLIAYDTKSGETFEKFNIPKLLDDMVVGNNFWINNKTRDYYALIFSKIKFENQLQLIKGNLSSPEVELVGESIPFQFHDRRSFATLYYMPAQNKLYTYVSYFNDNTTQIKIYSINNPPNNSAHNFGSATKQDNRLLTFIIIVVGLLAGLLVLMVLKRKKKKSILNNSVKRGSQFTRLNHHETIESENDYKLIFFGGFQVFDKHQNDITNKFSPLLKELFLLILLNTYKNNKGISSEKIIAFLWSDKSETSARNNRAVNIAKLKGILAEIGDIELSKKTGYWKINFSDTEIKSDYLEFLGITSSEEILTKERINHLIAITEKGAFLLNLEYEWLDDFKALVSDKIVDTLVEFAQSIDIKNDADFIIHLADSVFNFDIINEEAMILKCKAQYCMGKHSLAKATFEKFDKEYKVMYGQDYERSFLDIVKTN